MTGCCVAGGMLGWHGSRRWCSVCSHGWVGRWHLIGGSGDGTLLRQRFGIRFADERGNEKHIDQPANAEQPARECPDNSRPDTTAIKPMRSDNPEKEPQQICDAF